MVLSDEDIQNVLEDAMNAQFARPRQATLNFFAHNAPNKAQKLLAVSIHKWAISRVTDSDTLRTVKGLARIVVKEVAEVALAITGEMVFRETGILPHQPTWNDGSPLFASHDNRNDLRFGVHGGNIIESMDCFTDDISNAVDRLVELDPNGSYDSDERLRIFCAKPLERKFMRACAKIGVNCKVFGIRNYKTERSWVLARDESPCSMVMEAPSFALPVKGNNLVAGAKYVVWINDPRLAVCVTPKESL